MGKDKRRFVRLSLSRPPERYFLVLQLGIFLATLVFLLSILMTTVTSTMSAVEIAQKSKRGYIARQYTINRKFLL